jgi:hypothetical protein
VFASWLVVLFNFERKEVDPARVAGQGGELLGTENSCANTNGFVLASSNYGRETDAYIRTRSSLERFMC